MFAHRKENQFVRIFWHQIYVMPTDQWLTFFYVICPLRCSMDSPQSGSSCRRASFLDMSIAVFPFCIFNFNDWHSWLLILLLESDNLSASEIPRMTSIFPTSNWVRMTLTSALICRYIEFWRVKRDVYRSWEPISYGSCECILCSLATADSSILPSSTASLSVKILAAAVIQTIRLDF